MTASFLLPSVINQEIRSDGGKAKELVVALHAVAVDLPSSTSTSKRKRPKFCSQYSVGGGTYYYHRGGYYNAT